MKSLLITLLLLSSAAQSDDVVVSAGLGRRVFGPPGTQFERTASLGIQHNIENFFIRAEGGRFQDNSGAGLSSFWFAPLFGVSAKSTVGPQVHFGMGPGYLQNPDQVLGGHFQFSLEGGAGIQDGDVYLGVAWKHLSSAGINEPNQGRDLIVLQLRLTVF